MSSKNIFEKLAETNPECEIWWDSSPLVYANWAKGVVASAPAAKKAAWEEQLKRMFDPENAASMFFRSCTTNPPLSYIAMKEDPETWGAVVRGLIEENPDASVEQIFWKTYMEVIRRGAALLRPKWDASNGKYGYISGQVDPRFATDYEAMRKQAFEIAEQAPNIVVKCPGSAEGYRLIEELTAMGIGTNNTTSFAVPQYIECMNAVSRGLDRAKKKNVSMSRWRSVITHMAARIGDLGDLKSQAKARGIDLSLADIRWGEVAIFKRGYYWGLERNHPSKMLMCSMRVDKDVEPDCLSSWHIEKIAGSNSVYTCPPKYIAEVMEIEDGIKFDPHAIEQETPKAVLDKLMRIPYFEQTYEYDGMAPSEFSRYASFVSTASEFAAATRGMVDFVAQQFQLMGKPVLASTNRVMVD